MYTIRIIYCPEDKYLGRRLYEPRDAFCGADFAFSLHGGAWPKYMVVQIEGAPKCLPNRCGTQWTVGPLGDSPKQGLFEYGGEQRVLATAVGSPRTLKDVTEAWEEAQED